tara:strand:+ start:7634 stop:8689 length:1056 start_codon:yes stop_codon:yes gene_type:complete
MKNKFRDLTPKEMYWRDINKWLRKIKTEERVLIGGKEIKGYVLAEMVKNTTFLANGNRNTKLYSMTGIMGGRDATQWGFLVMIEAIMAYRDLGLAETPEEEDKMLLGYVHKCVKLNLRKRMAEVQTGQPVPEKKRKIIGTLNEVPISSLILGDFRAESPEATLERCYHSGMIQEGDMIYEQVRYRDPMDWERKTLYYELEDGNLLSDYEKDVIILCYGIKTEKHSVKEVSQLLSKTVSSINKTKAKAKTKLRAKYPSDQEKGPILRKKHGFSDDDWVKIKGWDMLDRDGLLNERAKKYMKKHNFKTFEEILRVDVLIGPSRRKTIPFDGKIIMDGGFMIDYKGNKEPLLNH